MPTEIRGCANTAPPANNIIASTFVFIICPAFLPVIMHCKCQTLSAMKLSH